MRLQSSSIEKKFINVGEVQLSPLALLISRRARVSQQEDHKDSELRQRQDVHTIEPDNFGLAHARRHVH